MTTEKKVQPKFKFRAGGMSVSSWQNKGKKGDREFTFNTFSLQRSYKDKDGNWQNPSLSLRMNDLPKTILCLNKAFENALNSDVEEESEED